VKSTLKYACVVRACACVCVRVRVHVRVCVCVCVFFRGGGARVQINSAIIELFEHIRVKNVKELIKYMVHKFSTVIGLVHLSLKVSM
jgi:hypothetical protein